MSLSRSKILLLALILGVTTCNLLVALNVELFSIKVEVLVGVPVQQEFTSSPNIQSSCQQRRSLTTEVDLRSRQPRNRALPIYWINLESSTDRRQMMEQQLRKLGVQDQTRIPAISIPNVIGGLQNQTLQFHPNITFDHPNEDPKHSRHRNFTYEYQEVSCTVTHLETIHQAYKDGHDLALILEDDARLSNEFLKHFHAYIQRAPRDWTTLQFYTSNPTIVAQNRELTDPFTTWQPNHWATTAYVINRKGMENVLNYTHRLSAATDVEQWAITDLPIVVADEVIYLAASPGAYTSTKLLVDTFETSSTLQRDTKDVLNTHTVDTAEIQKYMQSSVLELAQTVLVLMTVRASSESHLLLELNNIHVDSEALCQHHAKCEWEVEVVLVNASLVEIYEQSICTLPSNIHFTVRVDSEPYNKFRHVHRFIDHMPKYDLVVLKDADIRIAGFPWVTFVERKGDAVIASSLRQATIEGMFFHETLPLAQWLPFYEANLWAYTFKSSWAHVYFSEIRPMDVPLLEMFFAVMDGEFAQYYFNLILNHERTKGFINMRSDWGPDTMWCAAAGSWAPSRPSCRLVPVVVHHADSRQIDKSRSEYVPEGQAALEMWKSVSRFERWMMKSWLWTMILKDTPVSEVDTRCERFMMRNGYESAAASSSGASHDILACASVIIETNCPKAMYAAWKKKYSSFARFLKTSICEVFGLDRDFVWEPAYP